MAGHTTRTLQLSEKWDLTLDGMGRIAVCDGGLATAQNVANEGRLFVEDAYFGQDRGIPHFSVELGQRLRDGLLRSHLRKAALRVEDVKEISAISIDNFDPEKRLLSGSIEFVTAGGENGGIEF